VLGVIRRICGLPRVNGFVFNTYGERAVVTRSTRGLLLFGAASVAISMSRLALQAAMLRFDIGSQEMERLVAPGPTQHAVV
jgi:hypothetical protein